MGGFFKSCYTKLSKRSKGLLISLNIGHFIVNLIAQILFVIYGEIKIHIPSAINHNGELSSDVKRAFYFTLMALVYNSIGQLVLGIVAVDIYLK